MAGSEEEYDVDDPTSGASPREEQVAPASTDDVRSAEDVDADYGAEHLPDSGTELFQSGQSETTTGHSEDLPG